MRVLWVGPSKVSLVPVIRGPVSEGERVRDLFRDAPYEAIALSISPGELEALKADPNVQMAPSSSTEDLYLRELTKFGPVQKPPPCFVEAVRVSGSMGMSCFALDMGEEEFTELYCNEVSGWEMIRYSLRLKKLFKASIPGETPEDLVMNIDSILTDFKGHRRVEESRETHISSRIVDLSGRGLTLLALVDRERLEGVIQKLQGMAPLLQPS